MAKVEMTHVPYQGNSPATAAAVAGDVQITFDTVISARPFTESGQLRVLGVASTSPIAAVPDVPTIASVLPGFSGESWLCLYAPSATSADLIDRLRQTVRKATSLPAFIQSAASGGFNVPTLSAAEVDAFLKDDAARWRNVARAANIVLE